MKHQNSVELPSDDLHRTAIQKYMNVVCQILSKFSHDGRQLYDNHNKDIF